MGSSFKALLNRFFDDFLPVIVIILLACAIISGFSACSKSFKETADKHENEVKEHGLLVEPEVFISGMGRFHVIHDAKNGVTCYDSSSGISCIRDVDAGQ